MPMEDMLEGVVIGGIIAGISLFIGNFLFRHYFRPKLDIIEEELPREQKLKYPFIRVVVKNEGETAAQNCVGKITISNVGKGRSFKSDKVNADDLCDRPNCFISPKISEFIPITRMGLHWANTVSRGGFITINAHDDEALDVCKLVREDKNEYCINVFSEQGLEGKTMEGKTINKRCSLKFYEGKEYEGIIHITAANAKGTKKDFSMRMEGGKINLRLEEITEGWTRKAYNWILRVLYPI